jgi:putative ABC transport system ATP-binding protein
MSDHQIECISLSKQYISKNQKIIALNDVNIRFSQNEIVLLKGRSGSGKSTLLNIMCGLIKPTAGKVMIDNICITELKDDSLSRILSERIGIIFQSFNLLPVYTVYENIEMGLIPKGSKPQEAKDNIMSLLEQFDLINKAHLLPAELSAGQQQKVAIIRTLAKEPSIIFADEPTGSVDNETAGEILEHLLNMKREKNGTLIIATHGNVPEKIADRVITIENGRIKGNII